MLKAEEKIIRLLKEAVMSVCADMTKDEFPPIYVEVPREKAFGDFSANIAMRLTKALKKPPMVIADNLVDKIRENKESEKAIIDIKVAKPGFINFHISDEAVHEDFRGIYTSGENFGNSSAGNNKKVQIEFVSANPTGPLTVAHGRQAALGDSLAKILSFCGYDVTKEYYVNDEGVQMNILGESVRARFTNGDFPENGYKGKYIYEIADDIKKEKGDEEKPKDFFMEYAYKRIMNLIKKDLEDFGVSFDVWYSQRSLSESQDIEKVLNILKEKKFVYEKDGASWLLSTEFGDDKDRVVVKSDGSYTYLAPDIAYHKDKFERGYDRIINIWGPDHHGYIKRIKAACQALGFEKERVSILIAQLVSLYRDKKPVRMSTREGEFITLREVMDEVGKDAARFFFIMRKTDSHLDFDLGLAKAKSMDNPVFYIQYAHARISSILNLSEDIKADLKNTELLKEEKEIDIIKTLMQYPKAIEAAAHNLEPYTLLAYLQNLASLFHSYYDAHRIMTEDRSLTSARLALITAIRTILKSGLTLLGVGAPEKM